MSEAEGCSRPHVGSFPDGVYGQRTATPVVRGLPLAGERQAADTQLQGPSLQFLLLVARRMEWQQKGLRFPG